MACMRDTAFKVNCTKACWLAMHEYMHACPKSSHALDLGHMDRSYAYLAPRRINCLAAQEKTA